ncbi:MAG: SUMF1/EgtB/PvdO family nonheme iron enzyme [Phycisphaerales bacterium]
MKTNRTNGCRTWVGAWSRRAAMLVVGLFAAGLNAAHARPTPPPLEDPAHWATITHPGNEPFTFQPVFSPPRSIGRVDYEYRISKTEVTTAEWFEFVQAYKPFVNPAFRQSSLFTSFNIRRDLQPDGTVNYSIAPGADDYSSEMGFRFVARYCNWLHNGRVNQAWAFESGSYDTSTFGDLPGGVFTDQLVRSPGARYWVPSEDEWVKAAHWDPHKNGPNQPGYWKYPTTSDTLPVSGPPGVGQTNAGDAGLTTPVGAYTSVTSPWGLWDLSGGESEWTETVLYDRFTGLPVFRRTRGSRVSQSSYDDFDRIDAILGGDDMRHGFSGVRIATVVPSPSAASGAVLVAITLNLRRRRWEVSDADSRCGAGGIRVQSRMLGCGPDQRHGSGRLSYNPS